jgi:hypothetical protein
VRQRRKSLRRAFVALASLLACGLACAARPAAARAQVLAQELRTQGLAPDLHIQGGLGLGLGRSLANNFLGRVRLGGLYAYEPWIVDLGLTLELGGLAELGVGGELELNHFGGLFGQLAFARVEDDAWLSHVAVGYTIFGVEWQHRFAQARADDALLFCVRVPLGLWWFLVRHDDEEDERMKARAVRLQAEQAEQNQRREPAAEPAVSEDDRYRAQKAIERGREESEKGNHALAAESYARAYQLDPDPALLLLIVDAELAHGAWVAAAADLARFLELTRDTQDTRFAARRPTVQAQLDELRPRIPKLRLAWTAWSSPPGSDVRVELDGRVALGAVLGYDLDVDPGSHEIVVRRGEAILLQQTFRAAERELVRIEVDVAAVPAPAPASEPRHE